jgi:hypothetical protein
MEAQLLGNVNVYQILRCHIIDDGTRYQYLSASYLAVCKKSLALGQALIRALPFSHVIYTYTPIFIVCILFMCHDAV